MDLRVPVPPTDQIKSDIWQLDNLADEFNRLLLKNDGMRKKDIQLKAEYKATVLVLFDNLRHYMLGDLDFLPQERQSYYRKLVQIADFYTWNHKKVKVKAMRKLHRDLKMFMMEYRIIALAPPKRMS